MNTNVPYQLAATNLSLAQLSIQIETLWIGIALP